VHDAQGKLTGSAVLGVSEVVAVAMPVRGNVEGSGGVVRIEGALAGMSTSEPIRVAMAFSLAVDAANRRLVGLVTGMAEIGTMALPVAECVSLPIPAPMDGTWTLRFALAQGAKGIAGTAKLVLSNGVERDLVVKGTMGAGNTAILSLAGAPGDPAAKAIKIKATIMPLEGGWARLEAFSGKGYGQTIAW
jgi:hypothetical protein